MTETAQTPEELALLLRNVAEMTADGSKNWDNYQQILLDSIRAAFKAGKDAAYAAWLEDFSKVGG